MSDWKPASELPRVRKSGFSDYVIVSLGGFRVSEARIKNHTEWHNAMEQRLTMVKWWRPMFPTPDHDGQK